MSIADKFAEFVRQKRRDKKIRFHDLKERSGISKSFIYFVEDRRNVPSLESADRILDGLEESWEDFIEYSRKS
jgi:transcriptional regulator with XRE-family HTH domain